MSKYTIEVSVTPLCASCGDELQVSVTQSRNTDSPLNRDNPYERKDRRVYIIACEKCFVHKSTTEAIRRLQDALRTLDLPTCPDNVMIEDDAGGNLTAASYASKVGYARGAIKAALRELGVGGTVAL